MGSFLITCPITKTSLNEHALQTFFIAKNIQQSSENKFLSLPFSFKSKYYDYGYVDINENHQDLKKIFKFLEKNSIKTFHDDPADNKRYEGRDFDFKKKVLAEKDHEDAINTLMGAMNDGSVIFESKGQKYQLGMMSMRRDAYEHILHDARKEYAKNFKSYIKDIIQYCMTIEKHDQFSHVLKEKNENLSIEEKRKKLINFILNDEISQQFNENSIIPKQIDLAQNFINHIFQGNLFKKDTPQDIKDELKKLFIFKKQEYDCHALNQYFKDVGFHFQINDTCGQDYDNQAGKAFRKTIQKIKSQPLIDDVLEVFEISETMMKEKKIKP